MMSTNRTICLLVATLIGLSSLDTICAKQSRPAPSIEEKDSGKNSPQSVGDAQQVQRDNLIAKPAVLANAREDSIVNAPVRKPEVPQALLWSKPADTKPHWLQEDEAELAIQSRIEQHRSMLRKEVVDQIKFKAEPLSKVVRVLLGEHCRINDASLEEDGIDLDVPISVECQNCSVREVLSICLTPLQLGYRIRESGIEITTLSDLENDGGSLRTYDLSHMFSNSANSTALIHAIQTSIDPDSWLENGGCSTICMVGSVMVVTCPESVHFRIEELLRSISRMNPQNATPPEPSTAIPNRGLGGMGMF